MLSLQFNQFMDGLMDCGNFVLLGQHSLCNGSW